MKFSKFLIACALAVSLAGCGDAPKNRPYIYGADSGWLTEMEAKGIKFYDNDGKERECYDLMKSIGFNAARFRVWVQPTNKNGYGPWCDKADVIAKAKRAYDLGYKIMIDFHYSDNWADPGQQRKPEAWDSIADVNALAAAAAEHTKDVLTGLKNAGIDVEWVQIGNETTNGMLKTQSDRSEAVLNCDLLTDSGTANYIVVHNAAQKAAKDVFPGCKTIIHFDRGHEWQNFSWGLEKLVKGGAVYYIFGLSIYPDITENDWYAKNIDSLVANLNKLVEVYGKDVMVCEVGCTRPDTYDARRAVNDIVTRTRDEVPRCLGVFYWEPQCFDGWKGYKMGGFLTNGRPSKLLDAFSGKTQRLPEKEQ
jgi:arabinogalactan endo-1,4-beta-galactosidase